MQSLVESDFIDESGIDRSGCILIWSTTRVIIVDISIVLLNTYLQLLSSGRCMDCDWWNSYWCNEMHWRSDTEPSNKIRQQKISCCHRYCTVGLHQQSRRL